MYFEYLTFLSFSLISLIFYKIFQSEQIVKRKKIWIVICVLIISLPYYFFQIGADHSVYNNIIYEISINGPFTNIVNKEIVFKILVFILTLAFNSKFIFFLFGLIININILYGLSLLEHVKNKSIIWFFFLAFYYPWSFVSINQIIGISFIFIGLCYFMKNNDSLFLLLTFIGCLFHYSNFIFFIIGIIITKFKKTSLIYSIFISLLFFFFLIVNLDFTQLISIANLNFLHKLQYNLLNMNIDTAGISSYFLYFIPMVFALKFKKNNKIDILLLVSTLLVLIFIFFSKSSMIFWRFTLVPLIVMPFVSLKLYLLVTDFVKNKIKINIPEYYIKIAFLVYGIIYNYSICTGLNLKLFPLVFTIL